MSKEVLRAIGGIGTFPAISLVLFVITFVAGVVYALRMDRGSVDRLAALPLEDAGGDAARMPRPGSRAEVRPFGRGASRGA